MLGGQNILEVTILGHPSSHGPRTRPGLLTPQSMSMVHCAVIVLMLVATDVLSSERSVKVKKNFSTAKHPSDTTQFLVPLDRYRS